jgi:anti-anti-sigma factor
MSGASDFDQLRARVVELEAALEASRRREHLLRQLVDNIPSAIYLTGRDGTIHIVNTVFAAQWGSAPADFEGRTLRQLFPPETAAAWESQLDSVSAGGEPVASRETYGEPGAARHYDNLRFPISGVDGQPFGVGGVSTDVTDRVRAEEAERDSQRILRGLVDNSPDVIYVKSPESRLMLLNQPYARVIGRPLEELVGKREDEIFPPELVAGWREGDREIFVSGQAQRQASTFYIDGQPREFMTVQFPLYGDDQRPYAICGISTDVTDLREAERERESLQEQIIAGQRAALRELSTPLIPIAEGVVVMPLVGSMDSVRAGQVMETLLEGVSEHRASIVILDITGLPVVDSQVANVLLQAAQAARLLGAEVVLTGIRPEVAQTLVGIGADLSGLATPGTLQAGVAAALRRAGRGG